MIDTVLNFCICFRLGALDAITNYAIANYFPLQVGSSGQNTSISMVMYTVSP